MTQAELWLEQRKDDIREAVFMRMQEGEHVQTALNIVLIGSALSVQIKQSIRKEFM